MTITVEVKNLYGKERIYAVCETAKKLLALTRQRTFNRKDIAVIRSLGIEVKIQMPEPPQI